MSWNLQHCDLHGPFCFGLAVDNLPDTIQTLTLWPHSAPRSYFLDVFQRFSELQELSLGISLKFDPDDQWNDGSRFNHDMWLGGPFDKLRKFSLHTNFCLAMNFCTDISVCEAFPVLQSLTTRIKGDWQGKLMADEFMALSTLSKLDMRILSNYNATFDLVVPAASHVQQLKIEGPQDRSPVVSIRFETPGIQLSAIMCQRCSMLKPESPVVHASVVTVVTQWSSDLVLVPSVVDGLVYNSFCCKASEINSLSHVCSSR